MVLAGGLLFITLGSGETAGRVTGAVLALAGLVLYGVTLVRCAALRAAEQALESRCATKAIGYGRSGAA
jgi:drug/metabolite transporter (DMT)-like permease